MRLRTALAGLGLLLLAHGGVTAARISRVPAQEKTFHDHDLQLLRHPLVFRGDYWATSLPVHELVPPDWPGVGPAELFAGMLDHPPQKRGSYRNLVPVHYVVSAGLPVVIGVSLHSIRLGPVLVLALLLLGVFAAASALGRRDEEQPAAGLLAAATLSMIPVTWQGLQVGLPTLGNMAGVALCLAALVRSDGFRRVDLALLAGLLAALATRWGESAGDALACLAVLGGPVVASAILGLSTMLSKESRWWKRLAPIAGIVAFAASFRLLVDMDWLRNHLSMYVLPEAGIQHSQVEQSALFTRLTDNLSAYGEALWWSLLGPLGAVALGAGTLSQLLRRTGRRAATFVVLAAPLSGLVALSLSAKTNDYYAAPVVPALAVLAGAGLTVLPRILSGITLAALAASWLVGAHLDIPAVDRFACRKRVRTLLAANPTRCELRPHEAEVYPWFRHWRRRPGREVRKRRGIGEWLWTEEGADWLADLTPGSLVLLQVPPGPGGGADVVQLVGHSQRPDVLFHRVEGGMPDSLSRRLLAESIEKDGDAWVLTFVPRMHTRSGSPQRPQPWMHPGQEGPSTDLVGIYRVEGSSSRP